MSVDSDCVLIDRRSECLATFLCQEDPMNAEIVATAIGEKVLETLEKEEQHIGSTLRQLENDDDEELEER
ncbi:hypothetical protein ABG067_006728 [Albugo candida]